MSRLLEALTGDQYEKVKPTMRTVETETDSLVVETILPQPL